MNNEKNIADQHIYLNGEFIYREPISSKLDMGSIVEYKSEKYIVVGIVRYIDSNDRIDIIRLDEHEKRAIMVNVEFKYETLETIEEFFIENYGYRFEKVKEKENS